MEKDIHKYDDIINIPHHYSYNHKPMTRYNRAAQFAPFAALNGYEEAIEETGRQTLKKKELTQEEKEIINNKINYLLSLKQEKVKALITYFVEDMLKEGGSFNNITGAIEKLDEINHLVILDNKMKIKLEDIIDIQSEAFNIFDKE